MRFEELVKIFVEVSNQAKLYHWQTFSKPEHETLGEFYDAWNDITDKFVESYAGLYGRPAGGLDTRAIPYADNVQAYMLQIAAILDSKNVREVAATTSLQNILDELSGLAARTAYLLTMKKV